MRVEDVVGGALVLPDGPGQDLAALEAPVRERHPRRRRKVDAHVVGPWIVFEIRRATTNTTLDTPKISRQISANRRALEINSYWPQKASTRIFT